MVLTILLIAGALSWLFGEVLMLLDGGPTVFNGTLLGVALCIVAIGIWGLKDAVGLSRPGRSGIVLVCFGVISLAMVQVILLTAGTLGALERGEISYGDIVLTPFYLLALLFMITGLASFAWHYRRQAAPERRLAPVFLALAALEVLRVVWPDTPYLHGIADMGVAALLVLLGASLIKRRRSTSP